MSARQPIAFTSRFVLLLALLSSLISAGIAPSAHAAGVLDQVSRDTRSQTSLSTSVLDDFNRGDGALGGNWSGATSGFALSSNQVTLNVGGNIYWQPTVFGVDQEAFVTLSHIDPTTPEINLVLKGQSSSSVSPGQLSISYSPSGNQVQIWSHQIGIGWRTHDAPISVVFADGDQFGVKARSSGQVEVYKNNTLVAVRSVTDWGFYAQSGYIGFSTFGTGTTTLDDFGGGTIPDAPIATSTFTPSPVPTTSGASFPVTSTLDSFDRADGTLGASWGGTSGGYAVASNQMDVGTGGNVYWQGTAFGADQEVFVTLTHIDPSASEINLVLKAQSGTSINPGQISVLYSPSGNYIQIWIYSAASGWQQLGHTHSVVFYDGDQFGAKVQANGQLTVYRNGAILSVWTINGWPYSALGGFIGLSHFGSGGTILDNFGGGNVPGTPAATPTAPSACTDPASCSTVEAIQSAWRCNIDECTSGDWIGAVIAWPSWSAYQNNARTGDNSRSVYSMTGEPLYPYMGSWADGCTVTAVSGITLIIEWQRGTDVWRSTFLEPGQSHTIDLIGPEDNALIEAPDGFTSFSVSLSNCTPQNIGITPTASAIATAMPSSTPTSPPTSTFTPTFTATATHTSTFTPTSSSTATFTATPSRTPTATFTTAPTNTRTFTPTATSTRTPTATNTRTFTPTATNTATNTATRTPTATVTPSYSYRPLYLSLLEDQTVGGVAASNEDILKFDGQTWSTFFDGSDVGAASVDLSAFSILDSDSILMSFRSSLTLNGISVNPQDIVRFDATSLGNTTAGTFSMYFDGSDVGLTTAGESVDSVDRLTDGRLWISTSGSFSVPGVSGNDEDILAFSPSSLGNATSGTWSMGFDGSDVGLGEEDVDALDVTSNGHIYLSTAGDFVVSGVAGADEDVFVCMPTSVGTTTACSYASTLYFKGSTWGLAANDVDAFNFLDSAGAQTGILTDAVTRIPTATATPSYSYRPLLLSLLDGQTVGGVAAADEDILRFDGQTWSIFFDGSDVGAASVDLSAFSILDADSLLMAFSSAVTLNGIAVTPQDVVRFDATSLGGTTAGTFSMYFDGGDVGLTTSEESIDSVDLISGPWLLISTTGNVSVTNLSASDEDVIAFSPASLGNSTSGTWTMGFDGSDVGLGDGVDEDVDALDVVGSNTLYLSTSGDFAVNGVSGADEDVFVCTINSAGAATVCDYASSLYFDGSTWGLSANDVDAFHLLETGP